tara:strand:+ start:4330 stop:4665 length:336 start_codon:yes stop_codon:yes gene_type:complete
MEDKSLQEQEIIDLGIHRKGLLNETSLRAFGLGVQTMIQWIFGDNVFFPKKIKGTQSEVDRFLRALSSEKNYMKSYKNFGLNDKRTYDNKYKLDKAVKDFEKETKLKWPFK